MSGRGIAVQNKYLEDKFTTKNNHLLAYKIRNVKPSIDNRPPKHYKHLDDRLKTRQLEEDRNGQIQRDNTILLAKFSEINRSKGGIDNSEPWRGKGKGTLNLFFKKREARHIDIENERLLKKMVDGRGKISFEDLDQERQTSLDALTHLCEYEYQCTNKDDSILLEHLLTTRSEQSKQLTLRSSMKSKNDTTTTTASPKKRTQSATPGHAKKKLLVLKTDVKEKDKEKGKEKDKEKEKTHEVVIWNPEKKKKGKSSAVEEKMFPKPRKQDQQGIDLERDTPLKSSDTEYAEANAERLLPLKWTLSTATIRVFSGDIADLPSGAERNHVDHTDSSPYVSVSHANITKKASAVSGGSARRANDHLVWRNAEFSFDVDALAKQKEEEEEEEKEESMIIRFALFYHDDVIVGRARLDIRHYVPEDVKTEVFETPIVFDLVNESGEKTGTLTTLLILSFVEAASADSIVVRELEREYVEKEPEPEPEPEPESEPPHI